jgi:arsenate reductase (thioredoxin)
VTRSPSSSGAARAAAVPATVLFACVHNAGRSQMAAAFFAAAADPSRARAVSAGTQPAERVHPEVVAAMACRGFDLSRARPQRLTPELARGARLLVTMGCGEQCPVLAELEVIDWPLPDPKGQESAAVAVIRDEIAARVGALVTERGWGPPY